MKTAVLFILIFLTSCFTPSNKSSKPLVLVTIPPYANFVEQIAGDVVEVQVFVPAGASPHDYEPTPKQVERFLGAKLWFMYGEPGEQKLLPFLKDKNIKDVDLSQGIDLITATSACGHHHGDHDLHFWFDPQIALQQCKEIAGALSEMWPEHQKEFDENYHRIVERLKKLDQEIAISLKPLAGSTLLLSHPALGYYCKRYGLHQLSVECDGKEPRPQQVARIVKEAEEKQVKVIFTEPQYNNKGAVLIAEKLKLPLYQINPYARDYFKMMQEITDAIVKYYGHPS